MGYIGVTEPTDPITLDPNFQWDIQTPLGFRSFTQTKTSNLDLLRPSVCFFKKPKPLPLVGSGSLSRSTDFSLSSSNNSLPSTAPLHMSSTHEQLALSTENHLQEQLRLLSDACPSLRFSACPETRDPRKHVSPTVWLKQNICRFSRYALLSTGNS